MATPMVEIIFDEAALKRVRRMLAEVPRGMSKVMPWALNRTNVSNRAEIVRRLRGEINMPAKRVRQNLMTRKATRNYWQASVNLSPFRVPLIHFGARQIKKGVSYKIRKSGGRKKIIESPRPFVQTLKSGHVGVFRRYRETTKRLPIIQLYGPSLGAAFEGAPGIATAVQAKSGDVLEKNVEQRIGYILNKWRGAG